MSEHDGGKDPRWGASGRDVKALAILGTLRAESGDRIVGGQWLDLGCGSGLIASSLARHVGAIQGVDPEPWSRWPELQAVHPNLRFDVGGVDDLPGLVPDASIDVALCNQVYEHVPDPAALVAELHRVLKPGGTCYFAGPNLLWPIEPHVHLPFVHWLPRAPVIRFLSAMGVSRIRGLDAWSLDAWRLRALLRGAGFELHSAFPARARAGIAVGEAGLAARLAARMPAWLERLLLPLFPGFVFILRKPRG
jgi:SAM-dependent methyltransferase